MTRHILQGTSCQRRMPVYGTCDGCNLPVVAKSKGILKGPLVQCESKFLNRQGQVEARLSFAHMFSCGKSDTLVLCLWRPAGDGRRTYDTIITFAQEELSYTANSFSSYTNFDKSRGDEVMILSARYLHSAR